MNQEEDLSQKVGQVRFAMIVVHWKGFLGEEEMGSVSDLLLFAGQGKEVEIRLILGVLSVLSNRTHSLLSLPADKKERINRILFFAHSSRRLHSSCTPLLSSFPFFVPTRRERGREGEQESLSPTYTCCDRDEDADGDERVSAESDVFIDAGTAEKV